MTARIYRTLVILLVTAVLPLSAVHAWHEAAHTPSLSATWLRPAVVTPDATLEAKHPAALRTRSASFDAAQFDALMRVSSGRFSMSLFDDVQIDAVAHRRRTIGSAMTAWTGRLGDGTDPASWFVLVRNGDVMVANIWLADGRAFEVRPTADDSDVHHIHELAFERFHECGTCGIGAAPPLPMPAAGAAPRGFVAGGEECGDDGSLIDVLIVYTPEAREAAGGLMAIEALSVASIESTNETFFNSEIETRLRLVHQAEIAYVEAGNGRVDLTRMRGGSLPEIDDLRDFYNADLVAMLISDDDLICGIAYVMSSLDPGFEASAFSVTVQWCAVGNLTFAHELGHNMGCMHDRENSAYPGLFSYSYGWRWITAEGQTRRTVMAYAPGVKRPYFSNPDILDEGIPTGVPVGLQNPEAHNALTINQSAAIIAGFRASDCPINCVELEWRAFGDGVDGAVKAVAVFDDGLNPDPTLYVGGYFDEADGAQVNSIARWNGTSWVPVGDGFDGPVFALTVFDDGTGNGAQLYAAGNFTMSGNEVMRRIARWNGTAWSAVGEGFSSFVNTMTVFNDGSGQGPQLYAAGNFFFSGGVLVERIARWDGTSWNPLLDDEDVTTGFNSAVRSLVSVDAGKPGGPALYAGGFFSFVFPDTLAFRVAKWDGDAWSALGTGTNSSIRALTLLDNGPATPPTLFAGGAFTLAGGQTARYVASWNGSSWSSLGVGLNGWVDGLTVYDDGTGPAVYAGGLFDRAGGVEAKRVARWDGVEWSEVSAGVIDPPGGNGIVCALFARPGALVGDLGSLVIGGVFDQAGDVFARNIAQLEGCPSAPPCPEDVDGNGVVDFNDTLLVFGAWGTCPVGLPCPADVDGNGIVDIQDVLAILDALGPCPQ